MKDPIERQVVIDALGERPMVWMDSDYEIAQRNQYDMDKLAIETVPSAQPEIIRCKDCKRWDDSPSSTIAPTFHRCRKFNNHHTEATDFCSYAERREEGGE